MECSLNTKKMDYYSLTVRRLNKECSKKDYKEFLKHIETITEIELHKYEFEDNHHQGGFHFHGLLSIARGFFRKKINLHGFHVYIVKLSSQADKFRWESYMTKNKNLSHDYTNALWRFKNDTQSDSTVQETEIIKTSL